MLWAIFLVLIALWVVAWAGLHIVGWYIHLLLAAAFVVLVIRLLKGRKPVP